MDSYMALKIEVIPVRSAKDIEKKINNFLINYEYEEIYNLTYKVNMSGRGIVIIEYFALVESIKKSKEDDLK